MTPVISSTYSECAVEFSYHMIGDHTGILSVELQPADGDDGKLHESSSSSQLDYPASTRLRFKVFDVQKTLLQRQNDAVCLEGISLPIYVGILIQINWVRWSLHYQPNHIHPVNTHGLQKRPWRQHDVRIGLLLV